LHCITVLLICTAYALYNITHLQRLKGNTKDVIKNSASFTFFALLYRHTNPKCLKIVAIIHTVMNQEQLSKITKVLEDSPRGMTVTQISKEINLNRNSVAKYLEVLLISGRVEMKTYGPAKVFFLSQRVPMSAMIDFSSDYIIILDRDLKITKMNDNFLKLVGTERETILGQRIKDGYPPVFNTPEMASNLKAALNGKTITQKMEWPVDETRYYFNIKIIPTTFEDGLPGVTIILENITEREKMERKFKESEERYRRQFEEALDAIFLVDAEKGIIVDCNIAATKLVGRTKSELIGKHPRIIHPPEEIEGKMGRAFRQHIKEKEGQVLEAQTITKNGEVRDVAIKANILELGDKKIIQTIFRDITERKKRENELILLANAVKMSTDSIVITDINAKIIDVNEATLKMYGVDDKRELIGKNSFDFIASEHHEKASAVFKELLEKGSLKVQEFKVVANDGTKKVIEMSIGIIKDADGKPIGLVAISRDVHEHKKTK